MKIWQLKSLFDNYQSFQLLNLKEDRKKYFDGKIDLAIKLSDSWGKIFIECVEGDKKSDCPMFWGELGTPMISRKAKEILEPLICNNVEFLRLIHDVTSEVYYLINVLNTVDAINYNKAVLEKLSTGLIIGFEKYAFLANKVEGQIIFKTFLNQRLHSSTVLVSDEFRNTVLENNFKGFEFVEVWDSEEGA
ncbi:imm11 family protein [Bacillus cereus]|uniref:imm11 family protein n=1 Tax=Bacillus cereus TaxID=1396 RepID=UPI0039E69C9C